MIIQKDELREQVETAVAKAFARDGEAMSSVAIVKEFGGRGASTPTLYRWVRAALGKGVSFRSHNPTLTTSTGAAIPSGDPPPVPGGAVCGAMGAPFTPSALATAALPVLHHPRECIAAAQQVMAYSRKEDGAVRNPRLLLGASENMRRAVESSVKLHDSILEGVAVERYRQANFDILREESPALAHRVLTHLAELNRSTRPDGFARA